METSVTSTEPLEVRITEDGGVVKRILTPAAEGQPGPDNGDTVFVHYVGRLLDGSVFDSSRDRGTPFDFELGAGRVIKGWDLGVKSMRVGETSVLVCRSDYAYGDSGSPPTIPGGATLEFEVELLRFKSAADLTGDGGVLRKVIKPGSGYKTPQRGSDAVVRHAVSLPDGTHVAELPEYTFTVGETAVPRAWSSIISTMKVGQEVALTTRADYTQGGAAELGIPAGVDVVLTLELLRIIEKKQLLRDHEGAAILRMLVEGEGWDRPKDGSACEVSYGIVRLDTAQTIVPAADAALILGAPSNAEALDLALMEMAKGAQAEVRTTGEYLFSAAENAKLGLDASTPVLVTITLRSFTKAPSMYELSAADKLTTATRLKDEGNAMFKAAQLRRAMRKYQAVIDCFASTTGLLDEDRKAADALTLSAHLNAAACTLKTGDNKKVVEHTNKALAIDKGNAKAVYRKAQALYAMRDFEQARDILAEALAKDADNAELKALHAAVAKAIKAQNEKDAAVFKKMFA